jgi:hypothetical protein
VVSDFRQDNTDPFLLADVMGAISGQIGELQPGTAEEIIRILDTERQRLDIREASVGGLSWTFGYAPRASSRLLGS